MNAEVLNGSVEVGDRIAVGVRDGSSGGIRLARVVELVPYGSHRWNNETRKSEPITAYKIKAALILTSGYGEIGKVNTYSALDRIVVLPF